MQRSKSDLRKGPGQVVVEASARNERAGAGLQAAAETFLKELADRAQNDGAAFLVYACIYARLVALEEASRAQFLSEISILESGGRLLTLRHRDAVAHVRRLGPSLSVKIGTELHPVEMSAAGIDQAVRMIFGHLSGIRL